MNKTDALRTTLTRAGRPLDALYLAGEANIKSSLVGALLKHDIEKGRIETFKGEDGRTLYHVVDQQEFAIERAIDLLTSKGYKVTTP